MGKSGLHIVLRHKTKLCLKLCRVKCCLGRLRIACLLRRIGELAQGIAAAYRGTAEVCELASAPPLKNDDGALDLSTACAKELFGDASVYRLRDGGMGSEDFASYTYELPCAYLLLGAGTSQEDSRYGKPMHNPKVIFNEDILPRGAALHTLTALRYLERT